MKEPTASLKEIMVQAEEEETSNYNPGGHAARGLWVVRALQEGMKEEWNRRFQGRATGDLHANMDFAKQVAFREED